MARAGGGRSSGSRSGGGRSRSRSSGGHRVGSRRAGSSRSYSSSRRSGSTFGRHSGSHGSIGGYRGPFIGCGTGILIYLIIILIVLFVIIRTFTVDLRFEDDSTSTIVREKLETDIGYMNNCIEDELGWFDNESRAESKLKEFWKETGIQPYIILKDYDGALITDEEKELWTINYYDENFTAENIFLYVYFAEEDVDNDVGYMCYASGMQTTSVMDSEAIDIFWSNIDRYWYTDMSTDDLFVHAFNDTAKTIMRTPTNGFDVLKWVLIVIVVIIVAFVVIKLIRDRNKRKKEEAEENQRILNTPLEEIIDDELTKKYTE